MTPEQARELIRNGETLTTEFKRARKNDLNDADLVDAVTCMANGEGGVLFLGVQNNGKIEGLHPRHGSTTDPALLQSLIVNRTEPPLATEVTLLELDSHTIAVIEVPKAGFPVGTKAGKYTRRTLDLNNQPQCLPFPLHAMLTHAYAAQGSDYAATQAPGASIEDLDPAEFDRFRRLCSVSKGDTALAELADQDLLRALRLTNPSAPDRITLGAVLLFGSLETLERYVPTHEVIFQELNGGSILTSETFRYPLFKAAEHLHQLLDQRNSEQELPLGILRVAVPRIPDKVIRETIANALTHRDFSRMSPISVQLDETRLRVSSPGGFPPGITLENLLDASNPRSPILTDAFKRAGIVDRAGRGIREIYETLLRAGQGKPDYSQTTTEQVIVNVPTSDPDLELVRFIADFENSKNISLTLNELRLLYDLKSIGPQMISELASGIGTSTDLLRPSVTRLIGAGLVEAHGSGRNTRYMLTAAFYRIADSDEYTRLKDTEPLQQEQLVLSYVQKFGSITRSKAASLCHLSPSQASYLLTRLRDQGKLELHGERRGARYELPKNK